MLHEIAAKNILKINVYTTGNHGGLGEDVQ